MGEPIDTRPLLLFSVLFMIVAGQIILFGLMSQLQIELFHREHGDTAHAKHSVRMSVFRANRGPASCCRGREAFFIGPPRHPSALIRSGMDSCCTARRTR